MQMLNSIIKFLKYSSSNTKINLVRKDIRGKKSNFMRELYLLIFVKWYNFMEDTYSYQNTIYIY